MLKSAAARAARVRSVSVARTSAMFCVLPTTSVTVSSIGFLAIWPPVGCYNPHHRQSDERRRVTVGALTGQYNVNLWACYVLTRGERNAPAGRGRSMPDSCALGAAAVE